MHFCAGAQNGGGWCVRGKGRPLAHTHKHTDNECSRGAQLTILFFPTPTPFELLAEKKTVPISKWRKEEEFLSPVGKEEERCGWRNWFL